MATVRLVDVGRSKVNKVLEVSDDGDTATRQIWHEVQKHLITLSTEIIQDKENPEIVHVMAGFHKVGEVHILENTDLFRKLSERGKILVREQFKGEETF